MSAYGGGYAIIQGAMGAVAGAGEAVANTAILEQKEQIEKLREQRLSALRTQEHATNVQTDITAKRGEQEYQQKRIGDFYKGTQLPATTTTVDGQDAAESGGTLTEGATTTTQPSRRDQASSRLEKAKQFGDAGIINQAYTEDKDIRADEDQQRKLKLEESKVGIEAGHGVMYQALAEKYRAEAAAITNGERYRGQPNAAPIITEKTDKETGKSFLLDTHSGAMGTIVPGQDAAPEKTHWFKASEPGKPAVPMHVEWSDSAGRPLKGGIEELYPAMKSRMTGKRGGLIDGARAESDQPEQLAGPGAPGNAPPPLPKKGDVVKGYTFNGGDPNVKSSWTKAAEAAAAAPPAPTPAPKAAPAQDAMAAKVEQETRAIEQGKQRDYSPEVKAYMQQQSAQQRAKFNAGDQDLLAQEQQRMLRKPGA